MKKKREEQKAKEISKRLRALRKSLSMSTSQVASAVGVTDAGYRNWECATAFPPTHRLTALADALCTSVDFILQGNCKTQRLNFGAAKTEWLKQGCAVEITDSNAVRLTLKFPVAVNAVGNALVSNVNNAVVEGKKEMMFKDREDFVAFSKLILEKTKNYQLAEALAYEAV